MCLLVIAYKVHPRYRLIGVANRDEYYHRPSEHLNFWKDNPNILAGRDLKCGGTWLGITRNGRFSAITNYRDPQAVKEGRPSRGLIVKNFLQTYKSPEAYLKELEKCAKDFNPFNVIVGDKQEMWYYSNRSDSLKLDAGIYGLSNHLLDTPWPKVKKAKQRIKDLITEKEIDIEKMFSLLKDKNFPPDQELPDTGIGYDKERMLSPIFIQSPDYGTRSSYVILMEENIVHIFEQNYIVSSSYVKENRLEFHIFIN